MKKINLIEWLWKTDSHEKQSPQRFGRYAAMLMMLLTLGVGQMWATDYYFRHWDANNSTQLVAQGSNIYSSYFILSGNISFKVSDASWTNANTYGKSSNAISLNSEYSCASTGSDFSFNFSTNRAYLVRFNASGSTKKLLISTFVPSAAAPSAVVSGTNAMFYIQGYEGLNYLVNSSKTKASDSYPMNYTGISYVNTAITNLSTYDRISNNPGGWNGDEATNIKSAKGGELITRANAKTAAKTASTTASVSGETLNISTTTNATTGVYGSLPLYIQYYIDGTFAGVTYSSSTASYGSIPAGGATARASTYNVSSLSDGTHTLKTVLTDGIIFWVADTDEFEISSSTATLTYHANYIAGTGSGTGSVPAAQTVAVNANATVAGKNTLAFVNYTFSGWDTEEHITGTHYDKDDEITMDTDKDLYAVWTRTIPLDDQGATTAVSGDVYGTYNSSSLPSFTNPAKTGYTFQGWYTQIGGGGNFVINTSRVFQASMNHWTNASCQFIRPSTSTSSLYAKWTQSVTLNANTANHGTGSNGSATATWNKAGLSSTVHTTAATGYTREGYYTAATGGTKILNADGSFAGNDITVSKEVYISDGKWMHPGATTLYAHYTPNNYTITLHEQGATTHGSPSDGGTISVTFDATTNLSKITAAPEKTGYTFNGYYDTEECDGTWIIKDDTYFNWDGTYLNGSTGAWQYDGDVDLYAKWVANQYTVTLDVDEDNHGTIASATTSQNIYYNDVTVTVPNRPTAANGYALDGYYTDHDGEGTKLINADGTWIASVTGYTDGSKRWIHADDVTLYAYYKKAEITELTVTPAVVATEGTVAATPTIDPMPEGTTEICWELQYSNGTPLPSQPIFSQGPDNSVIFQAPAASATYRIQATLRKGSTCDAGDVLSTEAQTFQVAGEHTVTVQYQDGDGRTLKDTIHIIGRPLEWTTLGDITPPAITGYKFARWDAGDGVTIKNGDSDPVTTTTTSSIQIKAVYDGTLTAVYTKKKMIYFYNTLGWSDVYVYFYNTDEYWNDTYGSGAQKTQAFNGNHKPYWEEEHGHMTQIEGTNIWYFDYEAAGYTTHRSNVAFTEADKHDTQWFYETKAVRRGDHNAALPMFVPLTTKTETKNKTDYYNNGYWMNYPENTGYTLRIYSSSDADLGSGYTREIAFPFSDDIKMPLKIDVEFNDANNHDYWFIVKKNDGNYHGKDYTFNQNYNNEQTLNSSSTKCKLVTSAPGNYTFTLTYHDGNYYIDVDFPIATGDYRIFYKDNATWSQGAHGTDWNHPSDVIAKINGEATEAKTDIVSFYISKGAGITPSMKFQYASAISDAGAVTWSDVASGTINLSSFSSDITEAGVYNIYVSQPVGGTSIRVDSIKPYTGNFYIRTDCAGDTKWDSYKTIDHQMTYSDYAAANSGFTHYFTHWVTSGTNVKFTIANDYSMCISDTLSQDYGTAIANISSGGALNSANANIRFMWNQSTNKISRAYIGGSGTITDRFLVLEGDAKMYDEYGHALTGDYQDHDQYNNYLGTDNQVIMHDDQNFLYERIIKVNTSARAKLTAKYNSKVQYFKGSEGDFAEGTTIELLGGDAGGKHKMRIVYDFKTNRLVTAYLPEGEIDTDLAINADLMLVREHQEEGQQITFNGGSLTDVHTVYGVMRFNRWTLNNKEKTGAHGPVGDPKSVYERSLYWISFPFDVNLSDVFGFGTYGEDWIIEYYDGESRAANGYWIDSPSFWRFVMPAQRPSFTLEAGKGYVLALEIANMKDNNTSFWTNNIEQVELFFPSAENVGGIEATNVTTSVHEHACTIDRTGNDGPDINKNRTRADSHWNMIGVPSYANYGESLTSDGETVITWNSAPYTNDLPFLYEWNMVDDSYTVQSGTTYPFKSMHSYMVQYHGNLCWHMASATPASAPRLNPDAPSDVEFRLELQQNDIRADQTFVKLSNNENVSADFVFDEDLSKEFNKKKANIYTLIDYIPAAGNVLPLSTSQKTIVPVGVQIQSEGEYTFSMPDGTEGIGITLIDNETGEHTNLGLTDYTVNLNAGTINDRFVLEISPVSQTTTDIETVTEDGLQITGARKVMIDGILYIVRDGQVFDARGARVQ